MKTKVSLINNSGDQSDPDHESAGINDKRQPGLAILQLQHTPKPSENDTNTLLIVLDIETRRQIPKMATPLAILATIQKKVWAGSLPLEIRLASADCRSIDEVDSYFVCIFLFTLNLYTKEEWNL